MKKTIIAIATIGTILLSLTSCSKEEIVLNECQIAENEYYDIIQKYEDSSLMPNITSEQYQAYRYTKRVKLRAKYRAENPNCDIFTYFTNISVRK
jgi:hypothetical protein